MAKKEEVAKEEKERKAATAARNAAAAAARTAAAQPASTEGKASPVTIAPEVKTAEAPKSIHTNVLLESDENIKLAANFVNNQHRLPWPVSKGYIVAHYGRNTVEGTTLDYFNTSLTIGTDVGASVKVVFEGDVVSVADVGGQSAVTVKHGNYFTSYGNLSSVSVNKGDHLHTGQVIGQVAAGDSGSGQLEFILMKELSPQNPEAWLRTGGR